MNSINEKKNILKSISENLGEEYMELIDNLDDNEINNLFKAEINSDIDTAVELTEEARGEISKKLLNLPSNSNSAIVMPPEGYMESINDSKEKYDGVAIPAKVTVDPVTGKHNYDLINTEIDNRIDKDITIDELLKDKNNNEISPDKYKDSIKASLGNDIEDSDVLEILAFISKVEKEKPKKIYPLLPKSVKKVITGSMPSLAPQHLEFAAREFLNMVKLEMSMDKQFIELEEAIKNEIQIPDMTDMYLDHIKDVMEKEMLQRASNLEEIDPEKAKTLRDMSAAFTDAYTYETLINKINNKKKIINKELTKELSEYEHYCRKFNANYKSSKFVITDIRQLLYILDRKLPEEISLDSIKKFIILFCKVCRKLNPENIVEHTYMYYTTKLIESLDHIDSPKTDISKMIVGNIVNVIRMIEED